jgi:hypothetical protein
MSAEHESPSWVERNDGFEHVDHMGRMIRVRFSRFHGAMVTTSATFLDGVRAGNRLPRRSAAVDRLPRCAT